MTLMRSFVLLFVSIIIGSCKKDNDRALCTVARINGVNSLSMYGHPDSSITLTQHSGGHVIKSMQRINPGKIYESTIERLYEYNGDRLVKLKKLFNGNETFSTFSYDANNNIVSLQHSWGHITNYLYENNKLMKLSYRHVSNSLGTGEYDIEFTYSNNNVIKAVETWIASGTSTTWLFSYSEFPNNHFKNHFFPDYFLFQDQYSLAYVLSQNLVSKVESSVGGQSVFNYAFFNGKVSMITETFTSPSNNFIRKADYEYTCP